LGAGKWKGGKYEAGIYYLDWRENGKRQRLSVDRDSDPAHQRKIRKLAELRALSQGLVVTDVEEEANKNHIKVALHDFLEEVQLTKQDKTWRGYKIALKYFQESCGKTHLEDIQRIDLLRFSAFLRDKKKLAPRTVHNKFACVLTFLEAQGVSKLVGKKDRPS
jgi:integrase/recombinase XerD